MLFNQTRFFTVLATGSLAAVGLNLHGTGFDFPDLDAFAVGRGMAVVATADNPSAVYFNPAGITQLDGNNVRIGVYGIYLEPSYQRPGSSTTYDNENTLHAIPQLFYTYSLKDYPFSMGLGLYSPFGLSEKWPQDTGFRTVGTQGSLDYYTINPVVAAKLPWNLSLAAGLMVNYSSIDLQQGLTPLPNNDLFGFKGDAWAVGYNLGLRWQPLKKLSFGVTFRSSSEMDYGGHTVVESNGGPLPALRPTYSSAGVNYPFPLEVGAGISYRPTEKWNLEFDAQYTDWNELGTLTIHQATPSPLVPLSNVPLTLDWESSWYFEWGVTRYFDNGWHVSAGYIFNENSVLNAHYTPLVADEDRHFFSLGVGYQGEHLSCDLAYQLGYGPDNTVVGSAAPLGYPPAYHPADGTYAFISHALMLSVGWHF
jgi:long-chain fatty acid transport protein